MKKIHNIITFIIVINSCVNLAYAANTGTQLNEAQRALDRIDKEKQRQLITNEKQREQQIKQDTLAQEEGKSPAAGSAANKFKIDTIVIENDDEFEFSAARNAILKRFRGTLLGQREILQLAKELTDFYINRGYVTTQVTIVPGSLRSGKLVLKVLWGKTSGFLHNSEQPGWREKLRLFSAMPFTKEKILNMRDIDQGLDNLLRVSPSDRLLIEADKKHGYSLINHQGEDVFPLSVYLGVNNSGYRSAGWYQYYLNSSLKNILGLNDTLSYYYSWNDLYADSDSQSAKSFSFNIPVGYWLLDASYYKSNYYKMIGGSYGGYSSDGQSERLSLKIGRTLFRNAAGKYSAWLKAEKRSNKNNIMNFPIAVSSKDYSSLSGGLSWVGSLAGGWSYLEASMTTGMPWFGSAWRQDSDLTGFDIDYKKYNGTLSWSRRLATAINGRLGLDYELSSGFQYSNDRLVSDAKYSLGDEFTVRGFKENIVSAEKALWLSNTLKAPLQINYARIISLAPFIGFDTGMARNNCIVSASVCKTDYMSGAAVGIKVNGKDFSGSVTTAWPVIIPASLKNSNKDNYTLYLNLSAGF